MDPPKYNGNIHPDEWIKDIQKYESFWVKRYNLSSLNLAISLVDSTIKLPAGIDDFEKLRKALKEDISFTVFKNINKRKLQTIEYIPEREGGDTSEFISKFRKLCYNAEINDIEEHKKYLYKSIPYGSSISTEFINREERIYSINDMNDLIKEFEEIVTIESNFITKDSIVALKHVATGKYLGSIKNLCYTTGSESQLVFVGDGSRFDLKYLWKFSYEYTDTVINLQHIQSDIRIGIYCSHKVDENNGFDEIYIPEYYKSPLNKHKEVSCCDLNYNWRIKHSKLSGLQEDLKSNDIINLIHNDGENWNDNSKDEFLCSHDVQFTIGNDTFQEVFCHNESLGGNDEWCIELIGVN